MRMRTTPRISLIEFFPTIADGGGLFRYMSSPPWAEWSLTTTGLDNLYFLGRSGDKDISPLLYRWLGDSEWTLQKLQEFAAFILEYFENPWTKLFETFNATYNPMYNFSLTKSLTETHTDETQDTHTKGTIETRTLNTSDARVIDRGVVEQADKSAYNSTTYSPVDKVDTDEDTTDTLTKTGTDTLANSGSNSDSSSNSGGYTITESRSGYNGNYLYQQAIKADRELWQMNYFERVFADVDSLLTLPVYSADPHIRGYATLRGYPYI